MDHPDRRPHHRCSAVPVQQALMDTVTVSGRFAYEDGKKVDGYVKFIPSRVWVEEGDLTYPCMAPEHSLLDGRFEAELTRTDSGLYDWYYRVETPVGIFKIIINDDGPLLLKDLITKKYV